METSLTKEQFLQRLRERQYELSMPKAKIESSGAADRIISQDGGNISVNLSEIMALYVSHLIDVVYREPQ